MRAAIIERLMCDLALDLADFGGRDRFAGEVESLTPLADAGLLRIEGERIVMTDDGRPYVRIAAAAFDAYLAAGAEAALGGGLRC